MANIDEMSAHCIQCGRPHNRPHLEWFRRLHAFCSRLRAENGDPDIDMAGRGILCESCLAEIPPTDDLISWSSLGAPDVVAVRQRASPELVERVLRRADELSRRRSN